MDILETSFYGLHSIFAGIWAGSVLFVVLAVLPLAREGDFNAAPLAAIASRLQTISRVSAVVLLATGSHLAAEVYTRETLTGTTPGTLVLAMVGLWLLLAATVEIGTKRVLEGTDQSKVREPARTARPWLLAASLSAIGLLAIGGLITANRLGYFA